MMDAVHDVAVVVAAVLGLGLLLFLCAWIWAKVQPLPSATPALRPRRDRADTDALLAFPAWRKRAPGRVGPVGYERPLDVVDGPAAVPDDDLLPPPRQVAGRNGEA